jgi:flagellar hook-associated protein 3 FlgL
MISGTRHRLTLDINRQLQLAREIARGQTEVATGKRIQAPSDDPVGAARVSDIARTQADSAAWKLNLQTAFALSARADTVLGAAAVAVDRAGELMVAAANGTLSAQNRATVALELRSLSQELAALADSRDSRGAALFPSGEALSIPVGEGVAIKAVGTREGVFEQVATAGGPMTLAAIVAAAADAIELADDTARAAAIGAALDSVQAAAAHVSAMRGEQGARGNRIDQLLERLAEADLQLAEERAAVEGADVVAVIARLQSKQLTLQAAQAVFARVNQSTLFDLLR